MRDDVDVPRRHGRRICRRRPSAVIAAVDVAVVVERSSRRRGGGPTLGTATRALPLRTCAPPLPVSPRTCRRRDRRCRHRLPTAEPRCRDRRDCESTLPRSPLLRSASFGKRRCALGCALDRRRLGCEPAGWRWRRALASRPEATRVCPASPRSRAAITAGLCGARLGATAVLLAGAAVVALSAAAVLALPAAAALPLPAAAAVSLLRPAAAVLLSAAAVSTGRR